MKKMLRFAFSGVLLVATLVMLTGCDFFKKGSCPSCSPGFGASTAKSEDVLLSINGTPAITKEQFEDFYEVARANAGPYGGLSKRDAFDMMVKMEVLNHEIAKTGKDQTEAYKKDFSRAFNMARWGVNSQLLANELREGIEVSDSALEAFYNEKRGKDQAFDRPPFLKTPESIVLKSVEFTDKAAADAFYKKAKKDFEGAAKEANLTVKNLGNVCQTSKDVDFSVCLKAKTMKAGDVEVIQAVNKYVVAKAGNRTTAQYSEYAELKDMPQMKEMLGGYKQKMELEPAFVAKVEEYKKGLDLKENTQYFEAEEASQKAEEEKMRQMIEEQMKQETKKPGEKPAEKPAAKPSGVVAA